jgi:serine/threonine-protein kinase
LFFSVLVPVRPREALVALLASAAAVPLVYLIQVPGGRAPALAPSTFALVFVLPYLVAVALSYAAARTVHQLGVEVRRARELGSYRLETLLGRGGMGEVWRASHRMLARPAAIKLIRPNALGDDPEVAAARFEHEAQAIASLESPHTVELYDFGTTEDGTLYYVMELLDGVDLEELVGRFGPLPAERVVHVLRQACASLEEAHARGVVHRDIKPANIYLCRRALEHDVVKILDFGLAKRFVAGAGGDMARLTRADLVAGTPAYLAPEVVTGEGAVDGRADLYALGCVAFWLLTGRLVFEGKTAAALVVAHASAIPTVPSAGSELAVPAALDRVVLDCLAKDPAARPQTAGELADRLRAVPVTDAWTPLRAARWWEAHRPLAVSR